MVEKISEELLQRKNELIGGWDQWVHRTPRQGEQCAVIDARGEYENSLSRDAFIAIADVLPEKWRGEVGSFNDHNSKEDVLAVLDKAIASAKDRGI